jgi:serine/threonine protein kinase
MEPQASKKFGRYEIVGELGRGAMGVVYKARDPQIGRMVALKTVLLRGQEPEEEEEFRKRFLGEAQAAGRLQHPGIVAIYDVGEDSENHDPYLVLEFVNGESLNRVLAREKKLPLPRALQLAQEIAEALDYAHAQGVVHRDIKPANILLSEEGRAKIADLGIAQLNLAHFTLPGRVLGTPAYMAPEQLSGEGCDGRSDIFSLGVILYAMVTGHSPFHGNSATTVCFKVVNRDPMPASALDMDLPPALDAVISKAMAKDPAKRYQRGSEFAEDVRRLASTPGESSAWMQPRSGAATVTPAAVKPNAVVGVLHAEQLLRTAVQKASVKHLIMGGALLVLFLIIAIPTRKALTSQNASLANKAEPQLNRATAAPPNKSATTQQLSSASVSPAASAKPRESIIAEMQVDDSVPAVVPPAPPVRSKATLKPAVKATLKPAPKLVNAKTHSVANSAPQSTATPVSKPVPVAMSTLDLSVEHQFEEATLSVWVDNQLVLTRPLHGGTQKKLVVFKGFHGLDQESLKVPAGSHELHVRAQTSDQSIDLFKTMTADFAPGEDKTLQITFDKHNTEMRLAWRPATSQ